MTDFRPQEGGYLVIELLFDFRRLKGNRDGEALGKGDILLNNLRQRPPAKTIQPSLEFIDGSPRSRVPRPEGRLVAKDKIVDDGRKAIKLHQRALERRRRQ